MIFGFLLGYWYFFGYFVVGLMECGGWIFVWKVWNRWFMVLVDILGGEYYLFLMNNVVIIV